VQSRALVERPSTILNIAGALTRLGRVQEALTAMDEFEAIADPEADADRLRQVPQLRERAEASLCVLTVTVVPATASVAVDGETVESDAGVRTFRLDPGRQHVLRVSAEGYEGRRISFPTTAGAEIAESVTLQALPAHLVVTSVADALIRVDGEHAGTGGATLELNPGTHELEVTAERYLPLRRTLELAAGQELLFDAPLEQEPESLFESPILWTIVGVVVVGSAVGVGLGVGLGGFGQEGYGGSENVTLQPP